MSFLKTYKDVRYNNSTIIIIPTKGMRRRLIKNEKVSITSK
jgi:hypothetical protein